MEEPNSRKKLQKRNENQLTYVANLLPDFVASRLLLETECEIEIVSLGPDNEGLLLFLVRRIRLNLGL